jgi:uncharacterized membrane protein YraQ (UPF0718 family)
MQAKLKNTPTTNSPLRALLGLLVLLSASVGVIYMGIQNTNQDAYTVVSIFSTRFLGIFIEAVPFLLLGSFTSGLIEAFVRPDDLVRWMPRNKYLATILGSFMGLLFPVCECGVVPVARRLFTKGLPFSAGIAFLLAAPFMNPIVFASTYIAFGFGAVFVLRFVVTALVACIVGLVFALSAKNSEVLLPTSMLDSSLAVIPRPSLSRGLAQAMTVAGNEFFEMGRYLVIGCLMAAGMQTIVPQESLLQIGGNSFTSVLVLQILAFILSVCSTVDAFLALAFVNTFTTGSIVAFLSFGPMVDIKTTLMFLGVFQKRAVLYLVVLPFFLNLLAGVLINLAMGYT